MVNHYITPDSKHSALLIIDVQRDFTIRGAIAEIPGTLQVIQPIERLVQVYRKQGYPIIHVIRLCYVDGSNVDLCRKHDIENGKQVVIVGSDRAELMNELEPSHRVRLHSNLLLSSLTLSSDILQFSRRAGSK